MSVADRSSKNGTWQPSGTIEGETSSSSRHRTDVSDRIRVDFMAVATYARSQGKTPISFGPTELVCCRNLQAKDLPVFQNGCIHWEKNRIVSASQDGRLIVWNALTSQKTHAIKLPCAWVMTCAFSPTGQSGGLDSVCSIFNLNPPPDSDGNSTVSRTLSGHKGYVSSCQYVPNDRGCSLNNKFW
nr:guanine nucleotide-binding protein subunit beta-2 [Ipomoea batatas]